MSKPIIPIVFSTDNGYAPYASVAMNSLVQNSSKEYFYDIYVFHTDLSEYCINKLESFKGENYSVKCLSVTRFIEREMKYMYSNFHFSKEMFYRILIPTILSDYDRAMYLDCDLVVLGDIAELYSMDLEGNVIAAGNDIMHGVSRNYVTKELGVDVSKYINSGVLVIDCKAFRENDIKTKCFAELAARSELRYPDQDIINLACSGKIKYLERKWNYIWHYHIIRDNPSLNLPADEQNQYLEDAKDIRILHYTSAIKPWKNKNPYLAAHFWNYVEGCPFEEKIKKDFKAMPLRNYVGFQFAEEKDGQIEITASLYTLEGWTLDDIAVYVDGDEAPVSYIMHHTVDVAKQIYNRTFFLLRINPDDLQNVARVNFYHKGTGLQIPIVATKSFPVDFAMNGTYVLQDRAIYRNKNSLVFETVNDAVMERREKEREKALRSKKNDIPYKKSRILRKIYNFVKKFVKKEIWLISDRVMAAGDNGEAFFRYLNKTKPEGIKPIFVIDKKSPDYRRMKKYGKVVSSSSKIYKIYFMLASKHISSQLDQPILAPIDCAKYLKDILNNQKIVFLQHGIIKDDLSACYNRCKDNMSIFITSAKREYESIAFNPAYHCGPDVTKLTGLARFDLLEDRREKLLFIVPTWRRSCLSNLSDGTPVDNIKDTDFFKFYNALLHNERLIECARANGYRMCYYPHTLIEKVTPLFGKLDEIFVDPSKFSYTDVFCRGSLMLTDYSSTQFDFGYLKKPVVYTHFDREEFTSSHTYVPGYFSYEDDGFGEVLYDLESTVDTLVEYLEGGCQLKPKYLERIEGFYAYTDKNNCQRIFNEIIKLK